MLISKRRLYWGAVLCLTFVGCVLVRPMRSWLDRVLVSNLVCSDLQVDEIHLYRADSVVEARGLSWTHDDGDRRYGLLADKAWFAIDPVALIDRRWEVPTSVITGATLLLDDSPSTPKPMRKSVWQQEMAKRLATFDWTDLQKHFSSLMAVDGVTDRLESRVADWLTRSRKIVQSANVIEAEAASLDNPLRFEDDLRGRLTTIDELRGEQAELMGQFDSVRSLLEAEASQLEELFARDDSWLASRTVDEGDVAKGNDGVSRVAADVLVENGEAVWRQFSSYGEIAARLADGPAGNQPPQFGRAYRHTKGPLVDLQNVTASGVFGHNGVQTDFTLLGNYRQQGSSKLSEQYAWSYSFRDEVCDVQVELSRGEALASELTIRCDSSSSEGGNGKSFMAGDILLDGERLSGVFHIYLPAVLHRSGSQASEVLAKALEQQADEESVGYRVSGTWADPVIEPIMAEPKWLIDTIERKFDAPLNRAIMQARDQLNDEFQQKLARLRSVAQIAATESQAIAQTHRTKLGATHVRLQASLDDMTGSNFAGRSDRGIKR